MGWPTQTGVPYDYQQITVSNAAVGLTINEFEIPESVIVMIDSAPIRYRVDGRGDPTSSVGIPLRQGDLLNLNRGEAVNFRAIRTTGTDATLYVTFYHNGFSSQQV
jgi:hypothetical protein